MRQSLEEKRQHLADEEASQESSRNQQDFHANLS
jgi:hypothetical protein